MRGSRGGNSVVDRVKGKGPNKYKQLRTNLMRKKQSRGGIGVSPLNRVNSNQVYCGCDCIHVFLWKELNCFIFFYLYQILQNNLNPNKIVKITNWIYFDKNYYSVHRIGVKWEACLRPYHCDTAVLIERYIKRSTCKSKTTIVLMPVDLVDLFVTL